MTIEHWRNDDQDHIIVTPDPAAVLTEQRPLCAHLHISWHTQRNSDGFTSGWWECDNECGARMVPEFALSQQTARADLLEERLSLAPTLDVAFLDYANWREKNRAALQDAK